MESPNSETYLSDRGNCGNLSDSSAPSVVNEELEPMQVEHGCENSDNENDSEGESHQGGSDDAETDDSSVNDGEEHRDANAAEENG